MPYEVKKNGDDYDIINTETHDVVATRDTHEEAEEFVKLLHEVESDPTWDEDND